MNHPQPIAIKVEPLTQAERDLMENIIVQVFPLFGGWEGRVIDQDTGREYFYSQVCDTGLAAYIDAESAWMKLLDKRIADRDAELREMADQVEYKGEVHGRRF